MVSGEHYGDVLNRDLAEPGCVYAMYLHHGRPVKGGRPSYQIDSRGLPRPIELSLPRGEYSAEWHETRSFSVFRMGSVPWRRRIAATYLSALIGNVAPVFRGIN